MTRDQRIRQLPEMPRFSLVMLKGQWASHLKFRNVQLTVGSIEIALCRSIGIKMGYVTRWNLASGTWMIVKCTSPKLPISKPGPKQVLNLEWDEAGYIRTVSFRRGGSRRNRAAGSAPA